MDLANITIKKAAQLLRGGKISSVELTKYYLSRIKKLNPQLNVFISVWEKEALDQAKASDCRRKEGKSLGILDGIPIALKDNICTKGFKTTAGSKILENFVPPYDAFVVEKLKEAGVVILGKTNMDEFAMGSSTENSYFGPTKNPWDLGRVPGGSSGGSAAAVAADLCVFALGSDTGGSIRQPAAFCGICGFKPTYGAVSRYGLIAMASSLDQIGPITKTIEDIQIVMKLIGKEDSRDSTLVSFKGWSPASPSKPLRGLKIGLPKEYFPKELDRQVRQKVSQAALKLAEGGGEIKEVSLSSSQYALACYYIIMPSEVSSNLARYDGIKYGFSVTQNLKLETKNLLDIYLKSRSLGFGDEVKRRIMLGTYALSAGYYKAYYLQAQKVRAVIRKEFNKIFKKVDLLLTPTTPTPAFKLGEKEDPLSMYLSDIFTVPANIAGLPAVSVPCGLVEQKIREYGVENKGEVRNLKLPVGLQLIGPQFSDHLILKVALYFQNITDYHKQKPCL